MALGCSRSDFVDARERDLLTGMCNCYAACRENFEMTVRMVARNRNMTPMQLKETLRRMRAKYSNDADYRELRMRLPSDFPC